MKAIENNKLSCKECKNHSQYLWQNKNMKHVWRKECTQFNSKWAFLNPDGEKDTIVDKNKDPSLLMN